MCGIAGFVNRQSTWKEDIEHMNQRMLHRGPNTQGIWSDDNHNVVFGHVRLSILDLSEAGNQPMKSYNERYVLVLNGEIYNHKELRMRLISEGRFNKFQGHSDTEVLLEYISAYGFKAALEASIGMFAVALYDRKEHKIYLGRDRIGEKPLYYGFLAGEFVFASEIGCIREIGKNNFQINYDALALYFRKGYIPAPYTIYKEIYKVEAGSIIEFAEPYYEPKQYKYWDIMQIARWGDKHLFTGTEDEAADRLEELLKKSVRLQMAADVPVGAFLSGGIDSTAVVAVMQKLSARKVKTFSIGFEEDSYNEAVYAKKTAGYLGTDHTEIYVTSKDIISVIPKLVYIYGEPFADSSQLPTFFVSKLAKESVTVSLSGDGGDELFCGYMSYRFINRIWNIMRALPFPVRRLISNGFKKIKNDHSTYLNLLKYYYGKKSPEEIYAVYTNMSTDINMLSPESKLPVNKLMNYPIGQLENDPIENIMLMDMLMYLPDDILVKVDRSAMAVSLESRVPLLDKDIVEFAWTLPHNYKMDQNASKKVLRNVLFRYVPKSMMDRPKKGFSIPVTDWIRNGELKEWAEDMLNPERIRREAIIDEKIVTKMWNGFKKDGRGANYIWYLLMFEEWMEKCR